jgi:phage host-nuclease inhibitor protein Gam
MKKQATVTLAVLPPRDLSEVNTLVVEVGDIDRFLFGEKANLEANIEKLRKANAAEVAKEVERRKAVVNAIKKFAKKNRKAILPEGKKSLELPSGTIGWRDTPKKVVVDGKDETVIDWLRVNERPEFLRVHTELDREQLLKKEPADIPGVSYDQKEKFFVKPKEETLPENKQTELRIVSSS